MGQKLEGYLKNLTQLIMKFQPQLFNMRSTRVSSWFILTQESSMQKEITLEEKGVTLYQTFENSLIEEKNQTIYGRISKLSTKIFDPKTAPPIISA